MKDALIKIQIYYEIAMSIGNSLDLKKMLKNSLSAYLRKLNCSAGVVLALKEHLEDIFQFEPLFSIPRNVGRNLTCQLALKEIPDSLNKNQLSGFISDLPRSGKVGEDQFYHIMELPQFGLLIFSNVRLDFCM